MVSHLQVLMTVALLLLVLVMVRSCWNLPPVPVIRWWSVGFAGASLAWMAAHWRAELWKKRYHELEAKLQSQPKQSQSGRRRLPRSVFASRFCMTPDAVYRSDPLFSESRFPALILQCGRLAGLRKPHYESHRTCVPDCAAGIEAISAQRAWI